MKDFEFKIRNNSSGTYIVLRHKPCSDTLGYPKNVADALTIVLGHDCPEDKKRS
jgi:hypothetical protein